MSAHKLPQYYQQQRLRSRIWTASVTWYTCCNIARIKSLPSQYYYNHFTLITIIIILSFYPFTNFSHQRSSMVSHWTLSDSKSPHVSRTLLSIMVDLNNVVVWMVYPHRLISKSSSLFTNPVIGLIVSFMLLSFFQFPCKVELPIFLFVCFQFYYVVSRTAKFIIWQVIFFLLLDCLAEIKWCICISKSLRSLCFSFSWTDFGLCIYDFFVGSNIFFLHSSQWIPLPIQSCLVLYPFSATFLPSLIVIY